MKIYLKYNAESEKYALLVTDALQKAGHEVFDRTFFRDETNALQACHLTIELKDGKLIEKTKPADKPTAPKGIRKDADRYKRTTPLTALEAQKRTRFAAVTRAVATRAKDLMSMTSDQANFLAQKDQPGGKKTMKSYLWSICAAAYDAEHNGKPEGSLSTERLLSF